MCKKCIGCFWMNGKVSLTPLDLGMGFPQLMDEVDGLETTLLLEYLGNWTRKKHVPSGQTEDVIKMFNSIVAVPEIDRCLLHDLELQPILLWTFAKSCFSYFIYLDQSQWWVTKQQMDGIVGTIIVSCKSNHLEKWLILCNPQRFSFVSKI